MSPPGMPCSACDCSWTVMCYSQRFKLVKPVNQLRRSNHHIFDNPSEGDVASNQQGVSMREASDVPAPVGVRCAAAGLVRRCGGALSLQGVPPGAVVHGWRSLFQLACSGGQIPTPSPAPPRRLHVQTCPPQHRPSLER